MPAFNIPNSNGETEVRESNPCHTPGGSVAGGQFCSGQSGNLFAPLEGGRQTLPVAEVFKGIPSRLCSKPRETDCAKLRQPGITAAGVPKKLVQQVRDRLAKGEQIDHEEMVKLFPRAAGEVRRLLKMGERALPEFERFARRLASATGLHTTNNMDVAVASSHNSFVIGSLKSEERSLIKVITDYSGDAGKLQDVVRGSIVVNSLSHAERIMRALPKNADVVLVKDHVGKPLETGYRDINLRVRLPGGMISEVQILLKPMERAKRKGGHDLYKQYRNLPESHSKSAKLKKMMMTLYEQAWREAA